MKVKRFVAANMQLALRKVSQELGADAVIMSSKKVEDGFEVVAAPNKLQLGFVCPLLGLCHFMLSLAAEPQK